MSLGGMEVEGEVGNVLTAGAEQLGAIRCARGLEAAEGLPAQRRAGPPWAAQGGSEQHAGQVSEPVILQKCHHLIT